MKLTLLAAIPGLLAALWVMRLLVDFIYEVSAYDTLTYVAAILFLALAALLACYIPARRAAGVDPIQASKCD